MEKRLLPILAFAVLTLSMCTKSTSNIEVENQLLKSEKTVVFDETKTVDSLSHNKAKQIYSDKDWIAFNKISSELITILLRKGIDLNDKKNFNSTYFYKQLGSDASVYRDKMKLGKEHISRVYKRYFSDIEICTPCNTMTPEREKAYANVLDQIRKSRRNTTSELAPEPGLAPPDCWNVKFFACGGLCAMTIEAPPVFALCMALCISEYCTPPLPA